MYKTFMVFLALLFASTVGFAESRHYEAENCEFHVEKIQLIPGSYQTIIANIYLKVALPHLDGAIKAIGVRALSKMRHGEADDTLDWRNIQAERVTPFGPDDQWKISLLLAAGGLQSIHEGVFFLQTTEGTWYWLHPDHQVDKNFVIDSQVFTFNNELVWNELWINDVPGLSSLNPDRCQ